MKKIYLSLLAGFLTYYTATAQLTLTQAANQPVAGENYFIQYYDSLGAVPKSTGNNQVWSFSSLPQNTLNTSTYFVNTSSVPSSSLFSGSTLADTTTGQYTFYKSSLNKAEVLGFDFDSLEFNYSNPVTVYSWPFSYGTSFSDTYTGNYSGSLTGTITGNITKLASGSGTLILPNGQSLSNVLQLISNDKSVTSINTPSVSYIYTSTSVGYEYFHSSQKIAIMNVSYEILDNGFSRDTTTSITVTKPLLSTGIPNQNLNIHFVIFPNPAKDEFHLSLSNEASASCLAEIVDATGRMVKTLDLGNAPAIDAAVSLNGLTRGIYLVKLRLGTKTAAQRLTVD